MAIAHRFTGTAANGVDGANCVPTLGGTTNAGDLKLIAVVQKATPNYANIASAGYTILFGKNNAGGGAVALLGAIRGARP